MSRNPPTIHQLAHAQADALARWRQSKTAKRREQYCRRMSGIPDKLSKFALPAWLAAVERDDRRDERELVLEEAAA